MVSRQEEGDRSCGQHRQAHEVLPCDAARRSLESSYHWTDPAIHSEISSVDRGMPTIRHCDPEFVMEIARHYTLRAIIDPSWRSAADTGGGPGRNVAF